QPSKMYFRQLNDAGTGGTVPLMMLSNGNVLMNGNVGIGTTNPQYKLDVAGTIRGSNVSPSDQRLKQNIQPLENALAKVEQLRGVSFEWKDKAQDAGTQIGMIAQEVETVLPELVSTDGDGYKSLAYDKMTAVLLEAVKELKAQNDALKTIVCEDHPEKAICQ
ncbi:MAG TPA: tail fiber domain-containing protein, partial [Beggiatoa sp.]|nr:tail fiber domain-containing protein [Beggiatoa sp.]